MWPCGSSQFSVSTNVLTVNPVSVSLKFGSVRGRSSHTSAKQRDQKLELYASSCHFTLRDDGVSRHAMRPYFFYLPPHHPGVFDRSDRHWSSHVILAVCQQKDCLWVMFAGGGDSGTSSSARR
eukprot:s1021_g2.t1